MSDKLSADRLTEIIKTGKPEDCIAYLAPHPPKDRRAMAATAIALFKEWYKVHFDTMLDGKHRTDVRPDVARVAVFSTGSLTEMKACSWHICLPARLMIAVVKEFNPDWLAAWIDALLNESPYLFRWVHPIWEAGLCEKPDSDAYILGLIVVPHPHELRERPGIHPDLWRFFEIEGHGEFSLAAVDKYSQPNQTWAHDLCQLSEEGLMDRDRLLDASLDALARDFAQFRAGWYSRFHESLKPTLEEQIARKDRYLQLLGSAIPPTASFALKAIKKIDKAQPYAEAELLEAIVPVLQARQKGTVTTGLRLIETAAKRAPETRKQALPIVLDALIHEAADVQTKALDLLEKLGITDHPDMLEALKDYIDGVAPSLRPKVTALCGAETAVAQVAPTGARRDPKLIDPIDSYDAFIAEFLHVLEDTSDPLRIERAVDGLARHGADMPPDFDRVVGPLAKRAAQILKSSSDASLRSALAHLAMLYANQMPPKLPDYIFFDSTSSLRRSHRQHRLSVQSFVMAFIERNIDVLTQVQKGLSLPLLCAPTDDRGFVAPQTLIERVSNYEKAEVTPSPFDLSLALMRLAPEGREAATKTLNPDSEITRALGFALGGEHNVGRLGIDKTEWLWVAAAAARLPWKKEPEVETSPATSELLPDPYLPCLSHLTTTGKLKGWIRDHNADDIRWASLVWPLNQEPLFSQGLDVLDPEQKLSNSPYAAFIEPMLMPHTALGPKGAKLLSKAIASIDPAVRSLAIEALIVGIEGDRIDADLFAQATRDLITKALLPAARWTRAFGEVAKISPRHATYLCCVITNVMQFDPAEPPRDIGGLAELLFELHVQTDAKLADVETRSCLDAISAGGKLGKYSKKLLAL